ncbi:hypothetical protein [Streptacidiphilus jiangxiensis]|uniref:Uncharacterized protein n=1 Tax=Streptacidiphilus jiangxiensis TaxID=235985 RepID=A0A1H7N021_STRJI|nr:hypothetical protein [Streptacidiphilus jiangxiensis]SEL16671.1 hypothetical protein SAMN05414137_106145 [Streptacidiphilus jiangxiensis]
MDQREPQPDDPDDEESMDAAARRLQQEMDTALRHLREQARGWHTPSLARRGTAHEPPA